MEVEEEEKKDNQMEIETKQDWNTGEIYSILNYSRLNNTILDSINSPYLSESVRKVT